MPTKRRNPKKRRATGMSPVTMHYFLFGTLSEEFGEEATWQHIIEIRVTSSLAELWKAHRDEILEAWKATGRRGKCWAERGERTR